MKKVLTIFGGIILIVFVLWVDSLSEDNIFNGYSYTNVGGASLLSNRDKLIVVEVDVTGYRLKGHYIVGMRVVDPSRTHHPNQSKVYGYFVLNTLTDEWEGGMCWHELVSNLAEKDISINSFDRFVIDYL